MIFKTRKRLFKKYEKLNDAEKRIGSGGIEGVETGSGGIEKQDSRIGEKIDSIPRPQPTPEQELLPATETSSDGKRSDGSGKNSTRIGRIKRRFQRR